MTGPAARSCRSDALRTSERDNNHPSTIFRHSGAHAVTDTDTDPLHRVRAGGHVAGQCTQSGSMACSGHRSGRAGHTRLPVPADQQRRGGPPADRLDARVRSEPGIAHGRPGLAVPPADRRHLPAGSCLRPLLHVTGRSGAALLLLSAGVHGRHARCGAVGQPDPAGDVLGTVQPVLLHADRLLAPPRRRPPLAGVLMLGHIIGSYDLDVVLNYGETLRDHDWYLPTLILIALGVLTKSAQFPFHFWLPHAMAAPTPVSAYLHSATMVKAGIFLLMRLWPILSGTPEWTWIIGGAGVCTLLLGSFIAIFQHDLKGLLAYSTISHLGLITALLGIGTPLAMVAAIFHTLNHATFKASLFMAVGIIDHESGTRDMRKLRGLYHLMPHTATLAIVASAAMAGVPFLNGFISKE